MRLHALEVRAFGPFGDTVSVDFDALGADGLFLLHGQTGAGKTTVLDAVAFALYGRVPGARQDGKRLLSDHAEAGAVPRVVLVATIGGRRLRLTRSPEFQRAKRRGTGTMKENAKASLEWLDGHGQNLTRLDEIGERVGGLLGMSADQFFQVVLLPQGDFAKFLRADTEERGKLLERLFDTARFGTVEEWFADRRRASEASLAGKRSAVERLAAQVSAAAGIEAGADADPVQWAIKLAADAREISDAAALELASAQVAATKTEAALQRTRDVSAAQERAAAARGRLAEMAAGREARDELAVELDRALRAAVIAVAQLDLERAERAAATALAAVDEFAAAVAREPEGAVLLAQVSWPERASDPEILAAGAREWVAEVARLGDLIEQETQLRSARAELDTHRERRAELSITATNVEDLRAAVPGKLTECDADLVRVRAVGATLPMLAEQLTLARGRLTAATDLDRVRAQRATAHERHTQAHHAHLDAREALSDLRELRIAGMAAELAVDLVGEDECPVCGSAVHPALAQPSDSAVTKADEDAARAQERRRGQEFESVTAELAELDRTVEVLTDRAGQASATELAAAVAAADAAHTAAVHTAATETAALAALTELRTVRDQLAGQSEEVARDLAALEQRITDDTRRLTELEARISRAVGAESDLRARRDRLDALASATTELRDRRAVASRAVLDSTTVAAKVTAVAHGGGFDDVAQALVAVRPQPRIVEIEGVLTEARENTVRAEAVLADPSVRAAVALEPADLDAAESSNAAAGQVRTTAIAAASGAQDRAANVARYAQALSTEVGAMAPLLRRHEELAALADVIAGRGQNSRKMSLRSYVLAARLEEVALSASARLRRMSGGRYEFVHEDGAGPRGKRGGLGLDIRDDYTGVVRSAKTLSGGESFLASLALALGLADVVAAESGGVVLDTMFIDEGFGTLDADALESVMGVLDELRAGGRVVGIVSHVDEMRARIPSRLHVIRGRSGSSLEVVAG